MSDALGSPEALIKAQDTPAPWFQAPVAPPAVTPAPLGSTLSVEESIAIEQKAYNGESPYVPQGASPESVYTNRLNSVLRNSENPVEDRYRAMGSVWLSDRLGVPERQVFSNFNQYSEAFTGLQLSPEKFWTLIGNDFKRGAGALKLGHLGFELALKGPSDERIARINETMANMPEVTDQDRTWFNRMLGDVGEFLPMMGATTVAGLAGAKAGGLIAGGKGAAGGFIVGSAIEAFTLTQGNLMIDIAFMPDPETGKPMYQALFESAQNQILDPETGQMMPDKTKEEAFDHLNRLAVLYSTGGGILSALLEIPQLDILTGGKLLEDTVFKHLSDIAEKALRDSVLKNTAAQYVTRYGLNIVEEALQESVQESVEFWATELGKRDIAHELEVEGFEPATVQAWLDHVEEVFKSTTNAMLLMAAPGSMISASQKATIAKRDAMSDPDLQWQAGADSTFAQIDGLEFAQPDEASVSEANRDINPNTPQQPVRVIENADGSREVVEADQARVAAYEARGIVNVPIEVTPWRANLEANMTPETLASMNDWVSRNGAVLVPSEYTLSSLVAQDPERFVVDDQGNVGFLDIETKEITPVKSEVNAIFDESGLTEILDDMQRQIADMPQDIAEDLQEVLDEVKRSKSIQDYAPARNLLDDDAFNVPLNWFGDETAKKFSKAKEAANQIAEDIIPERSIDTDVYESSTTEVAPYDPAKRDRASAVVKAIENINHMTDSMKVRAEKASLEAELTELAPYRATEEERRLESAAQGGYNIADSTLQLYGDRPWAKRELMHRKMIRENADIYSEARHFNGRDAESFAEYIEDPNFWLFVENGDVRREQFMATVPEELETRMHFYEDMMDKAYFKTERNVENFIEEVSVDEGLVSWLTRMSQGSIQSSGITSKVKFAVSRLGRGLEPTRAQLESLRSELIKNAGYWQIKFLEVAAETDPMFGRQLQSQKDYEYLKSLNDLDETVEEYVITPAVHKALAKLYEHRQKFKDHSPDTDQFRDQNEVRNRKSLTTRYTNAASKIIGDKPLASAMREFEKEYVIAGVVDEFREADNAAAIAVSDGKILVEAAAAQGVTLNFYPEPDRGIAFLGRIQVDEDKQGQGLATSVMEDVAEFADKHSLQVQLSPTDSFGSNEARLTEFYKRFGFVENKGKNKSMEISNTMYRLPEATNDGLKDTTDAGLDKVMTGSQKKIAALRETIKSARQEASLQAKAVRAKERAYQKAVQDWAKNKSDEKWEARTERLKERLDKEKAKAEALRQKLRDQNKAFRAAIKAEALARRAKEKKLSTARKIVRPPSMGINVRIRDKITVLQGLLDPKFRSKKAIAEWQAEFEKIATEYNDEGLEALVTKYNMKPMPLNLWTLEQLEQLGNYIEGLRKEGRQYQDALDDQLRSHYRRVREEWIDKITNGKPPVPPTLGTSEGKKAGKSSVVQAAMFWTWRPSRIFRWLDGWAESSFYKFFVTDVNSKMDVVIKNTHARRTRGMDHMKSLGLSVIGLSAKKEFDGKSFTRDEMIHVWLATQNEKSDIAIRNGNQISDNAIKMIIADLSDAEKDWGNYMLRDFSENYQRLANVYELYMNEHMGTEKAYFPMMRMGESWEAQDKDFWDQFKLRNEYRSSQVDMGMTMSRLNNQSKRQAPIKLGATHVWNEQVEKHEHWVEMGMHVRDMNNIVHRWQTKDAVRERFGTQGEAFLTKYIEDVANPSLFKGHDTISMLSRILRKNAAIAYLAYNALTMMKQIPSIALFLRDVGPLRLMASATKYITNYRQWHDFIDHRDPQMESRIITKELELIRQNEKNPALRVVGKVGEYGMKGIQGFDNVVTHIGWLAVYDMNVNQYGEAEAVRKAQMAVLETQPSARAKDLAQMYRSGEAWNWLTMFSNQLNNIWNIGTADSIYALKNGEYKRLLGGVAGIGISAMCMMMLSGWRHDEDDESLPLAFTKQLANTIPLAGKMFVAGVEGWNQGSMEILPIASELGNVYREAVEWDSDDLGKALYDLSLAAGVTAGLPTTGLVRRPVKAIKEGDPRELFGSAYAGDD